MTDTTYYEFPNAENALLELLEPYGSATTWLEYGFEKAVRKGHPVIHIENGFGTQRSLFRTDRLDVTVYGLGRTETLDAANDILSFLTSGPHETAEGLIDQVDCYSVPRLTPYPHDRVNKAVAVYEVDTRPR